ncbi:copper resistance protein NlpE N-terminal domain-containing protein [Robertkochia aurantiaca]|uniref:copper resistance protein NlpE N-terminal domain-containing protein n=1 Tax=Robertkochia aurantiaca TaxID=2873700 RepID=UPI001CCE83EB|nr:copper resistance protein NlpE N-terminal domain-containing protein [Robertkochia sp. 3YJGBD-33]
MRLRILIVLTMMVAVFGCKETEKETSPVAEKPDYMDTEHNSKNALDWAGTYHGTLPCADCEGIRTEIVLSDDGTFIKRNRYLGKSGEIEKSEGSFQWNESNQKITLTIDGRNEESYFVGENVLFKLDSEGNRIEGDLASNYALKKAQGINERRWVLFELKGKVIERFDNARKQPHLVFLEDGRLVGSDGCNRMNGSYELLEGNRLNISKMATTMMACPDGTYPKEFAPMLETLDNYTVNGDTLSLSRARMAPLARFRAEFFE